MDSTFFFYDLETSGVNPRTSRIMQFAGQRTDMQLNPIGEPYNILIKLTEDVIPEPGAILVTGITPQSTLSDGITEAEFFKIFIKEIATKDTIFVGFNNIRFDDEFIRFGLFRNFYDPYEWQWKDGRSRWDILDLSRITRALRPEGIKWPYATDGKPTNRLEFLTSINKLDHTSAHDALSDVRATIDVAKLIKTKQPKVFDYSLNMRSKKEVKNFVQQNKTFVYVSGKYPSENEKLAVVMNLGDHPTKNDSALVYNLLFDVESFLKLSPEQLVEKMSYNKDKPLDQNQRLSVKTLQFNKCPAIAPLSTLVNSEERLNIDTELVEKNIKLLNENREFIDNVKKAFKLLENNYQQDIGIIDSSNVDSSLYNGFISDYDKQISLKIVSSKAEALSELSSSLKDDRLKNLLPLYKARNFYEFLNPEEVQAWENFKKISHQKQLPNFVKQMEAFYNSESTSEKDKYLLEEIKMYVESIVSLD